MDPQQRLLLEVSWEALEDAGQDADRAGRQRDRRVHRHVQRRLRPAAPDLGGRRRDRRLLRHRHRLQHRRRPDLLLLGLQGPSLAVDTACSSSLVAVHLACQSLRSGESDLALAGGVNLMLSPETSIFLSRRGRWRPTGAARRSTRRPTATSAARAAAWSCSSASPMPWPTATAILAVIRGSAVNQDGHSNGLTAPNGPAQEAVIRDALTRAGVEPGDVGYVEAHGTGTALGDPIEVQALAAVLGSGPPADGRCRARLGQDEHRPPRGGRRDGRPRSRSCSSLQRGMIPPHLHLHEPSPYIPWSSLPFVLLTALSPWPVGNGRRIAGVSAFGFSGTNAHVVLEEAPAFARPRVKLPPERAGARPVADLGARPGRAARPGRSVIAAADAFDDLLQSAGETEVQDFLETNPWLLGLDYAQIRARQPVIRGAVDFLLERFDGFHDVLELKSPDDRIFELRGRRTDISSPSAFRLSRPLALALAQVHAYRDVLSEEHTHRTFYGLPHTREPRITILIGLASELTEQEERILRELNRSLHRVEVVPFDVLARRAHAVLDNVERYLLAAEEQTDDDG